MKVELAVRVDSDCCVNSSGLNWMSEGGTGGGGGAAQNAPAVSNWKLVTVGSQQLFDRYISFTDLHDLVADKDNDVVKSENICFGGWDG